MPTQRIIRTSNGSESGLSMFDVKQQGQKRRAGSRWKVREYSFTSMRRERRDFFVQRVPVSTRGRLRKENGPGFRSRVDYERCLL